MHTSEKAYNREVQICVDPRIYLLEVLGNPYEAEENLKKNVDSFFKENMSHYEHIDTVNPFYFKYGTNDPHPMKDHIALRELLTNDCLGIKSSVCAMNIVDFDMGQVHDFLDEQRESYEEFLEVLKDKIDKEPEAFEKAASFAREHPFMTKEEASESMSEINFY